MRQAASNLVSRNPSTFFYKDLRRGAVVRGVRRTGREDLFDSEFSKTRFRFERFHDSFASGGVYRANCVFKRIRFLSVDPREQSVQRQLESRGKTLCVCLQPKTRVVLDTNLPTPEAQVCQMPFLPGAYYKVPLSL
ncbi:glycine cleavage T-protein (aminomethyl transferase) domain-containing protein [Toxoplasma gondii TgCatPRC2]|uniref:Glycine cleavage T-protein (Aminomethyl transferase) domain-containing protein n=1 Tax=Toxoplasma gondii TgCatPRC2 TaxID=1130821 RepID=A0A151HEZ2_TOXGO|nr:glycine cleavage T-protein (aminomethyl transferase) domain-containing protein [Toxoplasma gondii TgCatPRC2]